MNTFFIAGVQRSGTTLLSEMLSKHPAILLEKQSIAFRIISCFKSLYDILPYNLQQDKNAFLEWLIEVDDRGRLAKLLEGAAVENHQNIRSLIKEAIDLKLQKNDKKIWGDKSPNLQHYLGELLVLIPNTKIIHIVRDGRATAYSMARRSSKHLLLSAQHWVDGNIFGLVNQRMIGEENYKIIRYEDLLKNPESVMRSVCIFLNLDYAPELIDLQNDKLPDDKKYVKSFFDQSKIDKWKKQIPERSIQKIEKIQGPLLQELGYELLTPAPQLKHQPLSVWRRIFYNQLYNFRQLFVSKRMGMINREKVEIRISLKNRLYYFVKTWTKDLVALPIFKALFPRIYYKHKYYQDKPRDTSSPKSKDKVSV